MKKEIQYTSIRRLLLHYFFTAKFFLDISHIIYNLLCRELGFQGLVFTDALEMKGISQNENICAQALIAGNDLLLAPRNLKRELDGVLNAVKSGKLSEELITEKCRKVLTLSLIHISEPTRP